MQTAHKRVHGRTCWDALAPLPLKTSDHLLLRALLFLLLLLQFHHPLHQNLHLHRTIHQLQKIPQGCLKTNSRMHISKKNNVKYLLPQTKQVWPLKGELTQFLCFVILKLDVQCLHWHLGCKIMTHLLSAVFVGRAMSEVTGWWRLECVTSGVIRFRV